MELEASGRLQVGILYLKHLRLCASVGAECSRQLGLAIHFSLTFSRVFFIHIGFRPSR